MAAQRPAIDELLHERVNALENELRTARESLQATVEEMETSNEELQATNEELIASNEELQSTNEELHSVNEELYTVNAEYQAKIDELTELTADMNNLLEGTDVHTLFLDKELRIRKFTPRIGETFNLLPQDVGRRFETFAHTLQHDGLVEDIKRVLVEQTVGRAARSSPATAATSSCAILPYSGREDAAGGGAHPDRHLRARNGPSANWRSAKSATARCCDRSPPSSSPPTPRVGSPCAQEEWEAYTGHGWDEHRGEGWLEAFHPEDRARVRSRWHEAVTTAKPSRSRPASTAGPTGVYRWSVMRAAPLTGEGNRIREWVGHVVDIHERRVAETEVRRKEEQIRAIVGQQPGLHLGQGSQRSLPAGRAQCAGSVSAVPPTVDRQDRLRRDARWPTPTGLGPTSGRCWSTARRRSPRRRRLLDGEERTFLTTRFPLRDDRGRGLRPGRASPPTSPSASGRWRRPRTRWCAGIASWPCCRTSCARRWGPS